MRKLVLALGIVLILGIVATPIISAAPLTRDYLRYLGDNGFNILTTKEGGWFAGYTDKATAATTIAEFSTSTDLTEINIFAELSPTTKRLKHTASSRVSQICVVSD